MIQPRILLALAITATLVGLTPAIARPGTSPSLSIPAGNNQTVGMDATGRAVFAPIVVKVTNDGSPVVGAAIHFSASFPHQMNCTISGGRDPTAANVITDRSGEATLARLRGGKSISCTGSTGEIVLTITLGTPVTASIQAGETIANNWLLAVNPANPGTACGGIPCNCPFSYNFSLTNNGNPVAKARIPFYDNAGSGSAQSTSPLITGADGTVTLSYSIKGIPYLVRGMPESAKRISKRPRRDLPPNFVGTATAPDGTSITYSGTCVANP